MHLMNAAHVALKTVSTAPLPSTDCRSRQFKKLYRIMLKCLKEIFSDENLHRTRIRVKRVRYAAELAEKTVGKSASRFIRQIKRFQDLLGSHQDAVMTEHRLQELLRSSRSTKAAFAVGQIVERLRGSKEERSRNDSEAVG